MEKDETSNKHEVALCTVWLKNFTESSDKFTVQTSYHFKHRVEDWCNCYISNDAFIEAASELYPAKIAKGSNSNYEFKFRMKKKL